MDLDLIQSQVNKKLKHHDTAVILHLYYPEMSKEIIPFLLNLGKRFDLFVTIPYEVDFSEDAIKEYFPGAQIYRCENRGRDIAPFLAVFSAIAELDYKYICKIHTKKSPHIATGSEWHQDMVKKLLGSRKIISQIKKALDIHSDWGIVAPQGHVVPWNYYWRQNEANVIKLANSVDIPVNKLDFSYVAGSMFWFRPRALSLLLKADVLQKDFEPEQGQFDGTLAHAIERFFGLVAHDAGYMIAESDLHDITPTNTSYQFQLLIQEFQKQEQLQLALYKRIADMESGLWWKVMRKIRSLYSKFAPPGSLQDRMARLGLRAMLIWRREGFMALVHQTIFRLSRPNPGTFVKRSHKSYLSIPRLSQSIREKARQIDESGLFDHEWYLRDNPEIQIWRINPVQHYLSVGIYNERNPSPLFNTSIYTRSFGGLVAPEDALLHFYNSGRLFAPGAYQNAEILMTAQKKYLEKLRTECVKDYRSQNRKYAVFLQCGAGSVHEKWLTQNSKDWDLLVNHYDRTYLGRISCDVEFKQSGKQPGTKSTAFYALLENWPHIIEPYEYVLLLDDDIFLGEKDISNLFRIASENELHLAQASLSSDSICAHAIFRNSGKSGLRYVTGVEIMMPILSRHAIKTGRHLFIQAISGWGVDFVLGKLVGAAGKAAVIDDVIASHTKPINVETGSFYRMLHHAYIYPEIELTNLQRIYNVERTFHHIKR